MLLEQLKCRQLILKSLVLRLQIVGALLTRSNFSPTFSSPRHPLPLCLILNLSSLLRSIFTLYRARFFIAPLNMIDIIAIVPFYIELIYWALGQSSSIGFMRIIRCVSVESIDSCAVCDAVCALVFAGVFVSMTACYIEPFGYLG